MAAKIAAVEVLAPTQAQIENCASMGWEYLGEGLFVRGEHSGYFCPTGWVRF